MKVSSLPLGRLHEIDELVGKPPRGKEGDVAAEDVLALGRGPGHVAGDVGGVGQAVAHPGGSSSFTLKMALPPKFEAIT